MHTELREHRWENPNNFIYKHSTFIKNDQEFVKNEFLLLKRPAFFLSIGN